MLKNLSASAEDARDSGSIPSLGKTPGEGTSYPVQYSCLKNSMDRGTWQATVHGVTESDNWATNPISWKQQKNNPQSRGQWFVVSFPGGPDSKESACKLGDLGLIPESGRPPGEGNSYPVQYSCLKNSMDRGTWWATVHGVTEETDTTEQLTLSLQ